MPIKCTFLWCSIWTERTLMVFDFQVNGIIVLRQTIPTSRGITARRASICLKKWWKFYTFIFIIMMINTEGWSNIYFQKLRLPFYRMHLFLLWLQQLHLPQSALVFVEHRLFVCHEIFFDAASTDSWTVPEIHISDTINY